MQFYPSYEPWMTVLMSEEAYRGLIDGMKESFENLSWRDDFVVKCVLSRHPCSCWCCPCCNVEERKTAFDSELSEKAKGTGISNMRVEFAKTTPKHQIEKSISEWKDQNGTTLKVPGGGRGTNIGPTTWFFEHPQGYSIVFTTQNVLDWPPVQNAPVQATMLGTQA